MSTFDVFSPIASAKVRVLVLPVGKIRRHRFNQFAQVVERIIQIRLGDVTPDARPDRNIFSPLQSPEATIFYDFAYSLPSASHLALSPFEIFHEPVVVLGLADAAEYDGNRAVPDTVFPGLHHQLVEAFPKVLVHRLWVFSYDQGPSPSQEIDGVLRLPAVEKLKTTTIKTAFCDLTSVVLSELAGTVKALQMLPFVPSPETRIPQTQNGTFDRHATTSKHDRIQSLANGYSRPTSPGSPNIAKSHRMSMPVVSSADHEALSRTSSRSEALDKHVPAQTFDEITGANSRPGFMRSASQTPNRVSTTGFGSGGQDEANRNQGKARVGIICAFRYLQAGRWHEALKQFTEHGSHARTSGDHLWHGKALEGALTAMLLVAWAGMPLHIPSFCSGLPDRPLSGKGPPAVPPKTSLDGFVGPTATLQDLRLAIPDLVFMVLIIYQRNRADFKEALPPVAYADVSIRFARIFTALYTNGGQLDTHSLRSVIEPARLQTNSSAAISRHNSGVPPARVTIMNMLVAAIPDADTELYFEPMDKLKIISESVSILSVLNLHRKKGFLLKMFLETLTSLLDDDFAVQSALSDLSTHDSRSRPQDASTSDAYGLRTCFDKLFDIYGMSMPSGKSPVVNGASVILEDRSSRLGPDDLPSDSASGNMHTKVEVLRACIRICYTMSDWNQAMYFTSRLLRTVGPDVAMSVGNTDAVVSLSSEEQSSLKNIICNTDGALNRAGAEAVSEPEYWDDFLVRGVYVLDAQSDLQLYRQPKTFGRPMSLSQATTGLGPAGKSPFLYNAFEKAETKDDANLLVAGEEREFIVTLQNPYDFEVEIHTLKIMADEDTIAMSSRPLLLRSNCIQSFSTVGIVTIHGKIVADCCEVKVRGCRTRRFPIFVDPWSPDIDLRIKNIGLEVMDKGRTEDGAAEAPDASHRSSMILTSSRGPKQATVQLEVVTPQPVLVVSSVSIARHAIMLLEGQIIDFAVTVRNISSKAATLVVASCRDAATTAVAQAAKTKGIQPHDMFLHEEDLASPALRVKDGTVGPRSIAAHGEATYSFSVMGRAGLSNASVLFNYANVADSSAEVVRTRQVSVPLTITVNAGVHVARTEILTLRDDFNLAVGSSSRAGSPLTSPLTITKLGSSLIHGVGALQQEVASPSSAHDATNQRFPASAYSLLVLDVRNVWLSPIQINLACALPTALLGSASADVLQQWSVNEIIQPGHVERLVIPIPRIHIENDTMSIQRALRTANERQFIVSNVGAQLPDIERAQRSLFWYKSVLSKLLRAQWATLDARHAGILSLEPLALTQQTLDALRENDISISMLVKTKATSGQDMVEDRPRVGEFFTICVKLRNITQHKTIWPLLHLHPTTAYASSDTHSDITKHLTWSSPLDRPLKPLAPGQETIVEFVFCALTTGDYLVAASIEEMRPGRSIVNDEQAAGRYEDGLHGVVLDGIALSEGRRSWMAAQTCILEVVSDEIE